MTVKNLIGIVLMVLGVLATIGSLFVTPKAGDTVDVEIEKYKQSRNMAIAGFIAFIAGALIANKRFFANEIGSSSSSSSIMGTTP